MSEHQTDDRAGVAIIVALATAVASYLPSVLIWSGVSDWIRPQGHAEEAMGRGLEAVFIGGPAGAVTLAAIAAFITYRMGDRASLKIPLAILGAGAVLAYAILYHTKFFR